MEIDSDVKDVSLILIKQGAEARVFESNFVGRRSIFKERFSKKYRHPSLDSKLTLKRLNALYTSRYGSEGLAQLEKKGVYIGPERYTHEHMPIDVRGGDEIFRTCRP